MYDHRPTPQIAQLRAMDFQQHATWKQYSAPSQIKDNPLTFLDQFESVRLNNFDSSFCSSYALFAGVLAGTLA